MSKIGMNISIDVTKIDKAHLIEGKKGKYLNLTAFINLDEEDQYGNNCMVTQGLTKEARDAGEKGAILGNGKIFWREESTAPKEIKPDFSMGGGDVGDDTPFAPLVDIRF